MNFYYGQINNYSHFLRQTLSSQAALTYDEVVREMMLAEGQYIRELNMIIKVLQLTFSSIQ